MMGRYLTCFGTSKRRKLHGSPSSTHQVRVVDDVKRQTAEQEAPEEFIMVEAEWKIESEKQSSKRVCTEAEKREKEVSSAADCVAETRGEDVEEDEGNPPECSESLFSICIDSHSRKYIPSAEKAEHEVEGPMQPGDIACNTEEGRGSLVSSLNAAAQQHSVKNDAQQTPVKVRDISELFVIKHNGNANRRVKEEQSMKDLNKGKAPEASKRQSSSRLARYRYHDCSDEECGCFETAQHGFAHHHHHDDDDACIEEGGHIQQESSESFFSLSTGSRKQTYHAASAGKEEDDVNSMMAIGSTSIIEEEKENMSGSGKEKEMPWVEKTPESTKKCVGDCTPPAPSKRRSFVSAEDGPILGALSVEELRHYSTPTTNPPTRNGISQSPHETPIIGSIGSYSSHTAQPNHSHSPTIHNNNYKTTSRYP